MIPILDVWGQVWQIFYGIFVKLDVWVYKIAGACFDLIRNIYNFDFFSGGTLISEIKNRIYLALGIIMVFRIILAGVQYIVNPDTFDDKEKGMVGILKNALITVLLIAIVPAIFEFALDIQDDIVKEIPNLIFGKTETEVNYTVVNRDGKEENKTANVSSNDNIKGEDIAFSVLQGFISPAKDENNNKKDSNAGVGLNDNYEIHNIETFEKYATKNMNNGLDKASYSYMVIISTLGGGCLVYILASMAFDVAIRTIKLGIIQMLSPIPISSYMFKKENFNKFIKTSFKVYTDLFIRMLVIYVIILVVQILVNSGILDLGRSTDDIFDFLRNIILIFGLLMFAKSAPKFITELLGLPDVTSGDMAAMFKRAGGMFGATSAGLKTAFSNYVSQKERAKGQGKENGAVIAGLKSAAAGFGSATTRALIMAGQGKGFKDVKQNAFSKAISARSKRNDRIDNLYNKNKTPKKDSNGNVQKGIFGRTVYVKDPDYYGYGDYLRDVEREKMGIPSDTAFVKTRYDAMEKIAKIASDSKGHGTGKMNETPNRYQISFRKADGKTFANSDFEKINQALGYEHLSMEQIRNMYTMAKNGQSIEDVNHKMVHLNSAEIDSLGSLVQVIEKRTSYMKEAELMGTGDPAASPNVDKLVIGIASNKSMFTAPEIMKPIIEKMDKNLANYRINPNDANDHRVRIEGREYDTSELTYDNLLELTRSLQNKISEPKQSDGKYKVPNGDKLFKADLEKYYDTIAMRADILTGIKDSFEEVTKTQYKVAQIADNRAKKAQQAINNSEKKG